ncbi:MAG: hypothetical protein NTX61_05310 [Bacteroidetes bacterium]|nr:hypothetical protein [Bacteroidota bacterium]
MVKKLLFSFLLIFPMIPVNSFAQIRIASPYSRFGLGDVAGNNNAWNFSMGETGVGMRSPLHINYCNPASYTAFDSTSFLFEGAFISNFVTLNSTLQSQSRNYTSLSHILFGMPVTHWWRTSLGLVPFSDVGYNILNQQTITDVGIVDRLYSGSGGINRFFWGNGFRPFKNLSVGMNASYLFGSMNREATVLYPDSLYLSNFKVDNNITISDFYFNFGVQYSFRLKDDLHLIAGAVFAPQTKVRAKTDMVAQTFFLGADGTEHVRDTIEKAEGEKGTFLIPMMLGGGISLEKTDKWVIGIDSKWQDWSKFTAFGRSDSLIDSYQISVGAEFLPDLNNYNNYLKRIRYRIGFLYDNSYLQLRGKMLTEYAISAGIGLPLRGMKTALNLGIQWGSMGTTNNGLIQETYFRFVVGFSIYERWFVKRKYF